MIFMSSFTHVPPDFATVQTMPGVSTTQPAIIPAKLRTIDSESAWKQVLARDRAARFFYAVKTTGVFCRPDCSSRRPLRANVRFFATADAARAAGFRPCAKCKPAVVLSDGAQIRPLGTACGSPLDKIRAHIERNLGRRVGLAELGRVAGMSPFTVQRAFKREMGVSPLGYQRALRAGGLRSALRKGETVTDAIYAAGFGSSSRAYEGSGLGMTPARFAQGGKGEQIGWCAAPSPFGWVTVGATERGLCWLSLAGTKAEAEATLREEFPAATLKRDAALAKWVDAAMAFVREGDDLVRMAAAPQATANTAQAQERAGAAGRRAATNLDLRGTVFQLRVWQALKQIPRGETRTYSQLAREMGIPKSTRAVARACATNRVALLVPCHRVVGASGSLTGYRWGVERKEKLLEAERTASSR
jgi:AraC family transcriptional regulator, regulatory protein of adaptative response / methylated-DNA-[protein]-cysteine methyltransferase